MKNKISLTPYTLLFLSLPLAFGAISQAHANNKTLATVNSKKITTQDIQEEMKDVPEKLFSGRQDEIQKAIVERLIQKRLVMNEAKKLGILEDKTFQSQLATLKENLIFNFVVSRKVDEVVTSAKRRKYYQEHQEQFTQPAVRASHILLPTQKEAMRAIEQLDQGKDFKELAQAISTGPSATKGGALGWISPGDMVARFETAAFRLDEGDYTDEPIKTQFGWHIVHVHEKKNKRTIPFNEVEEHILKKLSDEVVQNYLNELQEKAEIEYNDN